MSSTRRADGESFKDRVRVGRREALEALRDELAAKFEEASTGVSAQIASQLRQVLKDLAELPDGKRVTKADELAARRRARISSADASERSAGR
jgi:hypothetical protein